MTAKQTMVINRMRSDSRIPNESIRYIFPLTQDNTSLFVTKKCLDKLRPYVPELVNEYVENMVPALTGFVNLNSEVN